MCVSVCVCVCFRLFRCYRNHFRWIKLIKLDASCIPKTCREAHAVMHAKWLDACSEWLGEFFCLSDGLDVVADRRHGMCPPDRLPHTCAVTRFLHWRRRIHGPKIWGPRRRDPTPRSCEGITGVGNGVGYPSIFRTRSLHTNNSFVSTFYVVGVCESVLSYHVQ